MNLILIIIPIVILIIGIGGYFIYSLMKIFEIMNKFTKSENS